MKKATIAIDLGATNLRVALISKRGKCFKKIQSKTPKKGVSPQIIVAEIIRLIQIILQDTKANLKGACVSVAGPVDYQKGEVVNPPNIPFKRIPIVKPLSKFLKLPVLLYNDCNAAVWGEKHFGVGKKFKNIVYITISSGIGGGAIVDGHLLLGKSGSAAEIGHFKIDTKYNFPCGCKKGKGHWEGYCSGNNLPHFFKFWLKTNKINFSTKNIKTSKDIFDLARRKEKIVLKFLEEIGRLNAAGINNVIVAYDPEIIVLGGSVVLYNKEFILPYFKKYIERFLKVPKITITPLKEDVVLFGAASLVFWPPN